MEHQSISDPICTNPQINTYDTIVLVSTLPRVHGHGTTLLDCTIQELRVRIAISECQYPQYDWDSFGPIVPTLQQSDATAMC